MALQIRANEWFNHRVYYGFYGVHSEWTLEHEQGRRKKPGTYALCISLFPLSVVSQATNSERYLKYFPINLDKNNKKRKTAKPCAQSISSEIVVNTGDCVGRRTVVSSCDLAVSEVFGVQAGGVRKGLGAVIKLPIFPPGSLQGSNSALIG